jgi:hypothetical protein
MIVVRIYLVLFGSVLGIYTLILVNLAVTCDKRAKGDADNGYTYSPPNNASGSGQRQTADPKGSCVAGRCIEGHGVGMRFLPLKHSRQTYFNVNRQRQ